MSSRLPVFSNSVKLEESQNKLVPSKPEHVEFLLAILPPHNSSRDPANLMEHTVKQSRVIVPSFLVAERNVGI